MTTMSDVQEAFDPRGHTWSSRGRRMNYTLTGSGSQGTVLLVAGLGMQRIEWQPALVEALLAGGYRVLMADNRECGRSFVAGSDFSLADMADDLIALASHLRVEPMHVVGISMGGMIAQHIALRAPEVCASLTSLMSTTGRRGVGRPHEGAKWIFTTEIPASDFDDYVDYALRHHASIAGHTHEETDFARDVAVRAFLRGLRPRGTSRQLRAIRDDGDRTDRLGALSVRTLVIHGDDDPMIDVSGGHGTAEAVPGATKVILPDVGHTIPAVIAPVIAAHLFSHFAAAAGYVGRGECSDAGTREAESALRG